MADELQRETEAYLARIRKTIAESESLVSQAELRIAETDRMLEKQGLTREQVMHMRFSAAQREAANEEMRRRGLEPLDWERLDEWDAQAGTGEEGVAHGLGTPADDSDLAARQRKFGMMMKPFQI